MVAYGSAVVASIAVGLGVKKALNPFSGKFTGSKTFFFTFLIALLANSSANATNLLCVRWKEYK
jgi:UDP-N-acetylmuramyl pentapeptide phosphotransferase/UDP-N-acetylglucosamine-1-phosphate transferase